MISITALLDSNILIDISRTYTAALQWLQNSKGTVFAIPSIVRMELVLGAQSKLDQEKVLRLLKPYALVYPNEADAQSAMERFERFHLSHRVEIIDCFIAAMSARLQLPIYSRNVRDLGVFQEVRVIIPY